MRRAILALLPAVLCGTAHAADGDRTYHDETWRFEMIQPAGWQLDHPDSEHGVRVRLRDPKSHAVCNMAVADAPVTANMTQEQINPLVEGGAVSNIPLAELKTAYDGVVLAHREYVHLGAEIAQLSEVMLSTEPDAVELYNLAVSVPGRGFSGNCVIAKDEYKAMRPEFDRIMRSLTVLP